MTDSGPMMNFLDSDFPTVKGPHLEIAKFVNVDIQEKWPKALSIEHLIYHELHNPKENRLSIRLPFKKTRKPPMPLDEWRAHLATSLRRSWALNGWFTQARKIDVERETRLGTLGYLPPEIRVQIWSQVLRIDHCPHSNPRLIFEDYKPRQHNTLRVFQGKQSTFTNCCGNSFIRDHYVLKNDDVYHTLRDTLSESTSEIDRAFFSLHTFEFSDPVRLRNFMAGFREVDSPQISVVVALPDLKCGCMYGMQPFTRESNLLYHEDWIEPLTHLSLSVKSLDFRFGEVTKYSNYKGLPIPEGIEGDGDLPKEHAVLDLLNMCQEMINLMKKHLPRASIRFSETLRPHVSGRCVEYCKMDDDDMSRFEAMLKRSNS